MDLKEYEDDKFVLAHIVRGIAEAVSQHNEPARQQVAELFARLAEDRFNVVVVGHFNRGKTSLMNALLGTDRLPTGIVPLTSVITTVSYGSREEVAIHYRQGSIPTTISIDDLPEYLTQDGNPGNVRNVKTADVRLPVALLRRGFYLVDTPGLGSAIAENTLTTEEYLGEADAFFLVTAYDSPLSSDEVSVLREAIAARQRVFVVVNKHDMVTSADRVTSLAYIRQQLDQLGAEASISLHSVSAKDAIEAERLHDEQRLEQSGLPDFEAQLVRFLLEKKATEFLVRTSSRIAELLEALPATDALHDARARLIDFQSRVTTGAAVVPALVATTADADAPTYGCEICDTTAEAVFAHLRQYQYDLTVDERTQLAHARCGGFCPFHAWQYASLASPQGIAKAYPTLLRAIASEMRAECGRNGATDSTTVRCPSCLVAARAERRALVAALQHLESGPSDAPAVGTMCVPHLQQLLRSPRAANAAEVLRNREAAVLERLAEDMQRFALKHDALRRALSNDEERRSGEHALLMLSGKRNLTGPPRGEDYL